MSMALSNLKSGTTDTTEKATMNYTEYKYCEDHEQFSILESPVGGYWIVTWGVDGDPILQHSTRTLPIAREIIKLEIKILELLVGDSA